MNNPVEIRKKTIIKCNIGSMAINTVFSALKIIVGNIFKISVLIADGTNDLSDALSAILGIISAAVASKKADKNHPMGYGRFEYISSLAVVMIVIYAGLKTLYDGITGIIFTHEQPNYGIPVILVSIISVVVNLFYGLFLQRTGRRLRSEALVMNGTDSIGDCLVSAAVIVAVLVKYFFNIYIENYLCIVIAIMILHTGFSMIEECMIKILGARADDEFKRSIKEMIMSEEEVLNVFNLVIHTYGEGVYVGSVDIEVDQDSKASDISLLSRRIIKNANKLGLVLSSVGICANNIKDPSVALIYDEVIDTIMKYKSINRAQSFIADLNHKNMSFYIIQDLSNENSEKERKDLYDELKEKFPDMEIDIYSAIDM